ncbi:type II toxin-antitoxin system VapC family toxin [Deinococcus sp.]|uniref:type II toxin-antitoxin system VapC family toxin n=1 Tax=Deinococcus sp. TaxID=47478 RepID=UPI003B5C361F
MRLSVDTNIIAGFWAGTPEGQQDIQTLRLAQQNGDTLLICGIVYTELCAAPGMTRANVDAFLGAAQITLDTLMPALTWHAAADANHLHQQRRRQSRQTTQKRVMADFLIGAHALHRADALITRNPGDFSDFPALVLVVPI